MYLNVNYSTLNVIMRRKFLIKIKRIHVYIVYLINFVLCFKYSLYYLYDIYYWFIIKINVVRLDIIVYIIYYIRYYILLFILYELIDIALI